jgi:hypothetical protein
MPNHKINSSSFPKRTPSQLYTPQTTISEL